MNKIKKVVGLLLIFFGLNITELQAAAVSAIDEGGSEEKTKKVTGSFITPDGHYTRFFGLPEDRLTSHLYKGQVTNPIPAVSLLHPYTKFIHPWVGMAAKVSTAMAPLFPKFVTDLPGSLANHFYVVIQDTPKPEVDGPHIIRLNYLLHTKDDEKTDGIDLAVGAPTGVKSVAITDGETIDGVYKRVSSHTHIKEGAIVASPDIGKLDFGKPAHEIESASFWMVHRIGGVKTPTLFIIINDIEKSKIYRSALAASPDMKTLMDTFSAEGLAADAATTALKHAMGYA